MHYIFAIMMLSTVVILEVASAVIPVRGYSRSQRPPAVAVARKMRLRRMQQLGSVQLDDQNDLTYTANITVGGQPFEVLVDTGSSDLWITGNVISAKDSGISANIQYAKGNAAGPIKFADVEFAGYTVKNQSFLQVQPGNTTLTIPGFLGLGPKSGSIISQMQNGAVGSGTVMDNIFIQNKTTPNYVTTALGRSMDPTDPSEGFLTIGEVMPGLEAVEKQPKLPIARTNPGQQHWAILLDTDGITVNGQKIQLPSTVVQGASDPSKLTAILDSGFTLPQVPKAVVEAMYSNLPGAKFNDTLQKWEVPCKAEINVTFSFGGQVYPMHPLDMSQMRGGSQCFGAFQEITIQNGFQDMVLGMAFLRNVYVLQSYGDFVDGNTTNTADPYVQLLSTTNNTALTHKEFVDVRLGGKESNALKLPPPSTSSSSSNIASASTGSAAAGTVSASSSVTSSTRASGSISNPPSSTRLGPSGTGAVSSTQVKTGSPVQSNAVTPDATELFQTGTVVVTAAESTKKPAHNAAMSFIPRGGFVMGSALALVVSLVL